MKRSKLKEPPAPNNVKMRRMSYAPQRPKLNGEPIDGKSPHSQNLQNEAASPDNEDTLRSSSTDSYQDAVSHQGDESPEKFHTNALLKANNDISRQVRANEAAKDLSSYANLTTDSIECGDNDPDTCMLDIVS